MLNTFTQEKVDAQYKKLPEPLREALYSAEIAQKIFEIGKKNGLNVDKIGLLAEEVGYVILGLTRGNEFVNLLKEVLQINEEKAHTVVEEVNLQIFSPIREDLKTAHEFESRETSPPKIDLSAQKPLTSSSTSAIRPAPLVKPTTTSALKDEVTKIIKTPEIKTPPSPPAGTMPSWMTKPEQISSTLTVPLAATPPMPPAAAPSQPIDLRSQYKPTMPPSSPKVPPINLRELGIKNKELGGEPPKSRTTTPVPVTPATPTQIMQETVTTSKSQPTSKLELGIRNKELGDNLNKQPETTKNKTSSSEIDPYRESVN